MKLKKLFTIFSVLIILVAGFFIFKTTLPQELKIATLSDIHIWNVYDGDNVEPTPPERLLIDAIEQINNEKNIDFTLITGDLLDIPDMVLFQHITRIFNDLKQPWHYAIGNHDRNIEITLPREELSAVLKRVNHNNMSPDGNGFYLFKPKKGYTCIALDGSDYYIDELQISFLKKCLDENKDDTVLIFLHTPVMPPMDLPDHHVGNQDKVIELLKQYNFPIAVIAGHYHATKLTQDGNVLHIALPSLKYSQEFRIIDIKRYKDKTVFNFDYKTTNLKDLITEEKGRYAGEYSDKFATITLKNGGK